MRDRLRGFALLALFFASACGGGSTATDSGSGVLPLPTGYRRASLKPGTTLATGGTCGVDQPSCPANRSCVVVFLDTGTVGPSCIPGNPCDALQCSTGSCYQLDSYPGQVVCGN